MIKLRLASIVLVTAVSFSTSVAVACERPPVVAPNNPATTALFVAIAANEPEKVRKALADGADPNAPQLTSTGVAATRTPLIAAIRQRNPMIVFDLLSAQADPNLSFAVVGDGGARLSPLGLAIDGGDTASVSVLVKSFANTSHVVCDESRGAQAYAASLAYPDIVELVTDGDVEPSALRLAISAEQRTSDPRAEVDFLADQAEVVQQLISIDFDAASDVAMAAILQSVKARRVDLAQVLLNAGVSSGTTDKSARLAPTLLQIAAVQGDRFMVDALLAAGADTTTLDAFDNSVLAYAAAGGTASIIQKLADHNAPLAANSFEQAPLMFVTNATTVSFLVGLGLDPNARDAFGRTALTLSVSPAPILPYPKAPVAQDNVAIAKALLDVGADPALSDAQGITPLMAVARGRLDERADLAAILIGAGAPLGGMDGDGATLVHHFAGTGDIAILKLLSDAGADLAARDALGRSGLHRILESQEIATAERANVLDEALRLGLPPDAADNAGRSPLHLVAQLYFEEGGADLAARVLNADADPNLSDAEGMTALMETVRHENGAVLLTIGNAARVNLNATTLDGLSALALAASDGKRGLVEVLLKLGADASLVSPDGDTPLHLALAAGRQQAALALIKHHGDVVPSANGQGRTPLILATREKLHDAATALLRQGANICHEDLSGKRAIDYSQRPQSADEVIRQIPPLETYVAAVEKYQRALKDFSEMLRNRLRDRELRIFPGRRLTEESALETQERRYSSRSVPTQSFGPQPPSLFSVSDYNSARMICIDFPHSNDLPNNPNIDISEPTARCIAKIIRSIHVENAERARLAHTPLTWSTLWALDTAFLELNLLSRDKLPAMPGTGAPLPADYPTTAHLSSAFRDARADGLWGQCKGRSLYFSAAEFGKVSVLNQWHLKNMPLGILDNAGRTASIIAGGNGHSDAVAAIAANADSALSKLAIPLTAGAFVDAIAAMDPDGDSSTELLFVESTLKPDVLNDEGVSPLMAAARQGLAALPVLRNLLAQGANPNLRDRDEGTALHYAAGGGNLPAVQALNAAGGTIDVQNSDGRTPRDLAQLNGHNDVVAWINGL